MKLLFKFAMTMALAGALIRILMDREPFGKPRAKSTARGAIADTNSVSGGNPEAERRAPQPQDWRGAQNVLE